MNKMTQATLATLVLGCCSTAVFAETESRPSGNMPQGCTELCKSGSIPIELKVDKVCKLEVGPAINLDKILGTGSSNFKVGANSGFTVLVDTDNHTSGNNSAVKFGSNSIATTVTTTGNGGLTLGIPAAKSATYGSLLSYNVAVATTGAYGVNTPAGTYTDTYRISVFF